jgi:hypothetical protein
MRVGAHILQTGAAVSDVSLVDYVGQLEGEVRKYLTKDINYGKVAKRMYNIFRLTGATRSGVLRELLTNRRPSLTGMVAHPHPSTMPIRPVPPSRRNNWSRPRPPDMDVIKAVEVSRRAKS